MIRNRQFKEVILLKPFDLTKSPTGLTPSISGISAGFPDLKDWISTGNKTLDYLISGDFNGGIPLGKVSVFAGESVPVILICS